MRGIEGRRPVGRLLGRRRSLCQLYNKSLPPVCSFYQGLGTFITSRMHTCERPRYLLCFEAENVKLRSCKAPLPSTLSSSRLSGAASAASLSSAFSTSSSAGPANRIHLYNSLKDEIEAVNYSNGLPFLKWYSCGPTVYDDAHLGHARTYVCLDIMRRVMRDIFGYNIWTVMGVTDVDDKIILKSKGHGGTTMDDMGLVARKYEESFFHDMTRLNVEPPTALVRVTEHMSDIVSYIKQIEQNGVAYPSKDKSGLYFDTGAFGEQYGKLLPGRSSHQKSKSGRHAETQIRRAVEKGEGNAHQSREKARDAVEKKTPDFPEKKEQRDLYLAKLSEAEQVILEEEDAHIEKKDSKDFALWKAAKEANEPSWDSPWGAGRPGWHIECSAMTHKILGAHIDIHTGGIDLKFPHHNNEIAQCEAHNSKEDWCKSFIHTGHLYISGLKMSKSLKNFITVRELLQDYTPDHFRIFCLQHRYRSNVHYSEDRMRDAAAVEAKFLQFFHSSTSTLRLSLKNDSGKFWTTAEFTLHDKYQHTKASVVRALQNDLDTPLALAELLRLVSNTNEYLANVFSNEEAMSLGSDEGENVDNGSSKGVFHCPPELLFEVADYVASTLRTFGLNNAPRAMLQSSALYQTGVPREPQAGQKTIQMISTSDPAFSKAGSDRESQECVVTQGVTVEEAIEALVNFRSVVRLAALRDAKSDASRAVLSLCDQLRQEIFPAMNVALHDLPNGNVRWEYASLSAHTETRPRAHNLPEKARNTKSSISRKEEEPRGERQRSRKDEESEQDEGESSTETQWQQGSSESDDGVPPELFFQSGEWAGKFSEYNSEGLPTLDCDGKRLSKSAQKKLRKKLETYRKFYLRKTQGGAGQAE